MTAQKRNPPTNQPDAARLSNVSHGTVWDMGNLTVEYDGPGYCHACGQWWAERELQGQWSFCARCADLERIPLASGYPIPRSR